jgi:membrane protein implicated in regulation of membrane protease activity
VLVGGEIWNAVATESVPAGASLRVTGIEQFLLRVEPVQPQNPEQPPA